MSSLFDDLKEGLEEAIAYEKGNGKAKEKTYMILPVKEYNGKEIRDVRMKAGMTQKSAGKTQDRCKKKNNLSLLIYY